MPAVDAARIELVVSRLPGYCRTDVTPRDRVLVPGEPFIPMVILRVCLAAALLATVPVLPVAAANATLPEYQLGDVATVDVVTPVPLVVMNPEATEALKQKVAQQVHLVVRHTLQTKGEVEAALRGLNDKRGA